MLELIYITHFDKGTQRNLSYAIELANAISGYLSLISFSGLAEVQKSKIPIWPLRNNRDRYSRIAVSRNEINLIQKEPDASIFLLGKSKFNSPHNYEEYKIIKRVMALKRPLFILPYNYQFKEIQKILFRGNTQYFVDHPFIHRLVATYLPRAFTLEDQKIRQIHWNNLIHLPPTDWPKTNFSFEHLATEIQRQQIDLTIFPINDGVFLNRKYSSKISQELLTIESPVLILPVPSEEKPSLGKESVTTLSIV